MNGAKATSAGAAAPHHAAWHDPAADPRTLYIGMQIGTHVDADAQALKVRPDGHNPVRVPFGRVGRIVCGTRAVWTQPALAGCARNGIPVVMAGARGTAVGVLVGAAPRIGPLDAEFTLLAERPDALGAWRTGLRGVRARLFRAAWLEAGFALQHPTWDSAQREFVCAPVSGETRAEPSSPAYAATVSRLSQAGLQLRYATQGRRWLELAHDIALALDDWHALRQPLAARETSGGRVGNEAFEAGHAGQRTDVVLWCVLVLRRALQAHASPWP